MNNICISIKSNKLLNERCNRKATKGNLCGIHFRSKNPIIYEDLKKSIYTLKNIPNYNNCDKKLLKTSISYYKILHHSNESRYLYNELISYLNDESINKKNSILIQKNVRRYLIQQLKSCVNQEDFYSLDNILSIPFEYIYILKYENIKYCFDIRSLNEYFKTKSSKFLNPYNNIPFSEIDLININYKIKKYENKHSFKIKQDILSPRQLHNQHILSVFQHFDNLGFILNIVWFTKLKFEQLKILYKKCEDIWNYRSQLTNEQKLGIVHNGNLFTIPIVTINRMKHYKDKELRNIILIEFNRAVTEGSSDANRKLGAILMLTGFAEVSNDVMNSYPWLSQSF